MERLDDRPDPAAAAGGVAPAGEVPVAAGPLPAALRGFGLPARRLRWLAPGLRHAVLLREPGPAGGVLRLLRVRPGAAIPRHAHRGAELACVIEGTFADETGRYGPGDLTEADEGVSHRPLAEGPADCVCLVATQGCLRFGGLLGPLLGLLAAV